MPLRLCTASVPTYMTVYRKRDCDLCMKITSWVGFERFLNNVPTVSRKAYLAYRAGVRPLHAPWKPIAPSQNKLMYMPHGT